MARLAALVLLMAGCAAAMPNLSAEACKVRADREFLAKVQGWCPPGPFKSCPEHDRLVAEHDQALLECDQ